MTDSTPLEINLIHYAIPAFAILMTLEILLTVKMRMEAYEFKDSAASLSMGIGNVILGLAAKAMVLGIFYFIYSFSLFKIPFDSWWAWVILIFAEDFSYYWMHRTSHRSRFFWASHIVHHSSQRYNLSTALRQTWTGSFMTFVFWLWLPLLGFHPLMIMAQMSISLLYQFWIHTEVIDRLPKWYEAIFNTPSHHRVHHATNPRYLDRNHAGIFIIWDRLFGTFEAEAKDEPPVYGLVKNIDTYNPVKIAFVEWKNLLGSALAKNIPLLDRFRYFIKPPGWKHDGSGVLSEDLRAEWEADRSTQKSAE